MCHEDKIGKCTCGVKSISGVCVKVDCFLMRVEASTGHKNWTQLTENRRWNMLRKKTRNESSSRPGDNINSSFNRNPSPNINFSSRPNLNLVLVLTRTLALVLIKILAQVLTVKTIIG